MRSFPPYVSRDLVAGRLPLIFPEGTPNRRYCIRELAASTVFTMLYIGAIEGARRFLGPVHVYRMTDQQARRTAAEDRKTYADDVYKKGFQAPGRPWYADNTREPIRDETLRDGLVDLGAVIRREDLPTTSGKPRYALKSAFAELFDPHLKGKALEQAILDFQQRHLSKSALARVSIMRSGAAGGHEEVLVNFPNGETRRLAPGPSSTITKAVIEIFARRFLIAPAVMWLSESGNKVITRDEALATKVGINIEADKNLPDLILVDLAPDDPLIVFVEVVATDGAITERRQESLYRLTDNAGFERSQVAFVTAYRDRSAPGTRKTIFDLAWNSFAWFSSEPNHILILSSGDLNQNRLSNLVATTLYGV